MRTRTSPLLIPLFLCLGACASAAKPEKMIPDEVELARHFPESVRVVAGGGQDTNALWMSAIATKDFVTALSTAIEQTGLFSSVVRGPEGGDYQLEVLIVDLYRPAAGFNMTVTLTTSWKLTHVATGRVVVQEFIDTPYTATVGQAFVATTRIRVANEGAARENIKQGLERLSQYDPAAEVAS